MTVAASKLDPFLGGDPGVAVPALLRAVDAEREVRHKAVSLPEAR